MPAEWEKHDATWFSWPKDPNTFPSDILPAVERAFVKMVLALSKYEEVRILVDDEKSESRVRPMLKGGDRVSFHRLKTVDVWVRDYGPTYVRGGGGAVVKWLFNAWGNKYDDLLSDNESGERLAKATGLRVLKPGIVMEGGSIDPNGGGSLLTTEQCLLNPNRNPGVGKRRLEQILQDFLGVNNVIWLRNGIEGDDTDGHIDDVARFVSSREVVLAAERNPRDPNHKALAEDREVLEGAVDERGRELEITDMPMPKRLDSTEGRLPASHLNFYIGNGVVLLPTFGGESDIEARRMLEGLLPRREVVGIDCRALLHGLGTLHCVTQQVPTMN